MRGLSKVDVCNCMVVFFPALAHTHYSSYAFFCVTMAHCSVYLKKSGKWSIKVNK